jgi:hypothetical protein
LAVWYRAFREIVLSERPPVKADHLPSSDGLYGPMVTLPWLKPNRIIIPFMHADLAKAGKITTTSP